VAKWVVEGV